MSSPQVTWDDEATKPPQVQWDAPQKPVTPPPQPGMLDSLNSSLAFKPSDSGIATAGKTAGQVPIGIANSVTKTIGGIGDIPSMAKIGENDPNDEYGIGKMTQIPGTDKSLALAPYRMGKNLIGGLEQGYEARQHEDSIPGKILATMENYPIIGGITKRMEKGQGIAGITEGLTDAATMKGLASLPKVPEMIDSIPRISRAGETLQSVKGVVGSHPIDIATPGNTALNIQKLADSGGSMPKVIRDFVKRATDPTKGPLTYAEARDFYSNASRLSADETNRLTPVMKRQVGQFRVDLGNSIEAAAKRGGVGEDYAAGMAEYRKAMRNKDIIGNAKDAAIKGAKIAIPGAAGAYAVKSIFDK